MYSLLIILSLILKYDVTCNSSGNVVQTAFDRVSFSAVLNVSMHSDSSDYKSDQIPDTNAIECPEMCKCNAIMADCSANFGNLTFVPKLPSNITVLIFSYNNLTAIYRNNFFKNVTNITALDLSHNGLSYVCNGTFTLLTVLTNLTLDFNKITVTILYQIKSLTTLRVLSMNSVHVNTLRINHFSSFLSEIHVSSCDIAKIKTDSITSLTQLQLYHNKISIFPQTCRNGFSLFHNLAVLNLSVNDLDSIGTVCLPNLQTLDLSSNRFLRIEAFTFNETHFPSLTKLIFQSTLPMGVHLIIEKNAFTSPTIMEISLAQNNLLFFDDVIVHPEAFENCSALESLQLRENVFEGITDELFYKLFSKLTSLRKLFLEYCHISSITKDTFNVLSGITELYLHGNSLVFIPDGSFSHMINLTVLHLGFNMLTSVRDTTFNSRTIQMLREIDLSGNPFVCSCDIIWLRQWLISNPSLFYETGESYLCNNLPNTSLTAFVMPDQACILSSDAFTLTVVSVCLVLITLITYGVLYRLRWHIRLFLYEVFRSRTGERRLHYLMTGHFAYDIFVSYAAEDLHWVRDYLIPELEQKMGLRLCIHQRDFLPGANIVDNIVNNLEKSKKVLMIFSASFSRSQWCQFELALCLQYVMDHDDILVIVYLDDLQTRFLTSTMFAVLKVTTCIHWDYNLDARASFWGRMKIAFMEILPPRTLNIETV